MRAFLAVALFLAAVPSFAARVIADVPATATSATHCRYEGGGITPPIESAIIVDATVGLPANGNRVCSQDASGALVGTNNVTFSLVVKDGAGVVWEVGPKSAVFTFVRPASINSAVPAGTRLVP